ncbi:hypothetical protein OF83DRAFT_1288245, partial [Amylostereum chailletii]
MPLVSLPSRTDGEIDLLSILQASLAPNTKAPRDAIAEYLSAQVRRLRLHLRVYNDDLSSPALFSPHLPHFPLHPRLIGGGERRIRNWDLWGLLILCLLLGIMLSVNAPANQALGTFTSVVVLVCISAVVVTVQAKLLGGRVSFSQGLCVLGYCV